MSLPRWAASTTRHGGRTAARAGLYSMSGNAVRFVANLLAATVLARLLAPADFGLMGMVSPVLGVVLVFADGGVNFHTLQRKEIDEREMTLVFWIGVGLGVLMAALFAIMAPILGWFYDEPAVTPITLAISLIFVVQTMSRQHTALCQRFMRQDLTFIAQIAVAAASLAVSVGLAVAGAGVWALVGLQFSRAIVWAAALWILTGWIPGAPRRHPAFREILGFGWTMVGARLAQAAAQGIDKVLLGWSYGAAALGYYQVAYQLMMLPMQQIQTPIAGITVPYLAQHRDDPAAFMAALARMASVVAVVIGPMMAVAGAVAEPLIVTVLGEQWRPAAPIFGLFAISVIFESVRASTNWSFLALGRPGLIVRWNLICAALIAAACVIALPYGPIGVATGIMLMQMALLPGALVYAAIRTGQGYLVVLRALLIPGLACIAVALAARLAVMEMTGMGNWTVLAAACGIWAVVAGLAALAVFPAKWRSALVARILGRRR